MTDSIVMTAKSVDEAVELALKELDADRGEVEVEVVSQGKTGFLGFGGGQAQVRVTRLAGGGGIARVAIGVVDRLMADMGVDAASTIGKVPDDTLAACFIEIAGDDSGLLIGRRGETLRALQFVVNLIVSHQEPEQQGRVILDVEHYKENRARTLRDLALRMADRVASSGRPIVLEPMPANERRVIHVTLAEHARVSTASEGFGDGRKVSITPKRPGEAHS